VATSSLWRQILTKGFGTVHLDPTDARTLSRLYESAMQFFAMDTSAKLRHSTPRRNVGYRPYGQVYVHSPERPDLNDSFLYWTNTRARLQHRQEIGLFLERLDAYQSVTAGIVRDLVREMRAHYGYDHDLPFEDASFIQVNSFPAEPERELLQDPHEDAVFLTLIWTSAEGLEVMANGTTVPVTFRPDELLAMPGSVLTDMTGGEIQPLYHQARNFGHAGRKSIMYFVSPEVDDDIKPFVVTDHNRGIDIRERVISNPQAFFGLSSDFLFQ
jgi:isopenicillin N synthase-like dioxygenase